MCAVSANENEKLRISTVGSRFVEYDKYERKASSMGGAHANQRA